MIAIPDPAVILRAKILPRLHFLLNAPRGELIRAATVAAVLGLLGLIFNSQFGIFIDVADTRCLPERVYMGYPRTETLNRGDIVSFRANNRLMFDLFTGHRIAKIIAGVPGDRVVSNETGAFVNGVKVGERNPASLKNLSLKGKEPVNMDLVLQTGELFVVGTLPRSFDSRYWGVLPETNVDRLVKALF